MSEKPKMKRECAWCGADMGTVPCGADMAGETTHGMCPACLAGWKKNLTQTKRMKFDYKTPIERGTPFHAPSRSVVGMARNYAALLRARNPNFSRWIAKSVQPGNPAAGFNMHPVPTLPENSGRKHTPRANRPREARKIGA